jgi:hypothetical protein
MSCPCSVLSLSSLVSLKKPEAEGDAEDHENNFNDTLRQEVPRRPAIALTPILATASNVHPQK